MGKRKKKKIIADKTPYLIRSGNILHYTEYTTVLSLKINLHYTEITTVLSLTKSYIIQRIPLSCHWQKPTLYREYHCPVTDKSLHYTENTTVLSLTNKKSLKIPNGNQNLYIEEEQTTQRPKENVQKDKQRSPKHTYKTKDRVTRTPLTTGGELRCSGRVSSSCSTTSAIITFSMHSKVARTN